MKNLYLNRTVKTCLLLMAMVLTSGALRAQLTGVKTIPTDYATIAAFVTDLNTQGVGSGGVTLNVPSGYTETAPAGGLVITTTGTSANPIVIQGTGGAPKPVITASASLTAGALNDAVIKLLGSDYVTISGLELQENSGNTTTAGASNNMTEFGIALFYASTTDGCQNVTLTDNTIGLGATYQNAMGIYANSTHNATAVTSSATATSGNNNNLTIKRNTISSVNLGIVVLGPTAATDHASGLIIGGAPGDGNTITFGLTGTFSGFANVSGTVNGIVFRNVKNATCSYNTLTSNGTVTSGTLNGIQLQGFSNTPTGTFSQVASNNTLSLMSAVASGTVVGITSPSGSATTTSTLDMSNNQFNAFGHSVASPSGNLTFLSTASTHFTTTINNNAFNNLTVATTGNVTFISHSFSIPTGGSSTASNNTIGTQFTKTGAGGTVYFTYTNGSSPNGTTYNASNNIITNVNLTGATAMTVFNNTDGSGSSSAKTITNNSVTNVLAGTSAFVGLNVTYLSGTNTITGNTFNNIGGQGSITGINLGSSYNSATSIDVSQNTISNLASAIIGGAVTGIASTNTSTGIAINQNTLFGFQTSAASAVTGISIGGSNAAGLDVRRNKIYDLSGSNAGSTVNGILVSSGTLVNIINNLIGDLRTPAGNAANPVNGINITGGTSVNAYYNSVYLAASSSGTNFGSSAIFANTTPTVILRNNAFVNNSTATGTGLSVAYRRSSTTLTSYDATSDRNDFYGANIFTDGTSTYPTLAGYQAAMATRDANSVNELPNFLSTVGSNVNYLHLNPALPTLLESHAANITGVTVDFDGDIRQGNAGYTGTGTAPDIGADEVEVSIVFCSSANGGTISPSSGVICQNATTTITSTGASANYGNTYQWKVATVSGGPYSNVTGGTGATTTSYTTGSLASGTYYFVLETTCSAGPTTGLSNEYTLVVNALPAVAVSPSTSTYCSPGGTAVALTASGALNFVWSPSAGLSGTTGSTVNASPSTNTTYTVTGVDANGCVNTATSTVVVNQAVTISSTTATPGSVCSGGNSQLLVTTPTYYNFSTSTGATLIDMSSATTAIGASVDDTPTAAPASIGFTFNFGGSPYTQYSVSPDGWVLLGSATAASQFTNAVTSTTNIPKLYPFWDDLATGTDGSVKTLLTGTSPNQIFVVQWAVTVPRNTSGPSNSTFQALLYEDGRVEYRYGTMGTPSSGSISAGYTISATNYQSITYSSNTSSASAANDANAIAPASGISYMYTPAIPTYSWSPSTFLSATNVANPMATNIAATTTYNATVTLNGCSATGTVTVTAGSTLSSSAVASPGTTVCAGTNITVTGSGSGGGAPYTYAWTGPGSFTSTSAAFTLTSSTPAQSGMYTVVVTDACGATSSSSVTLTINALPAVSVTPTSATYCFPGTGVTLTASGASTFAWTPSSGLSATTGSTVIATPSAQTTYTVTGTDINGCIATASTTIDAAPAITSIALTATPASVCFGSNSVLAANAVSPTYTYCTSTHTNGCSGDNMASVVLGSINNSTGTACGGSTHQSYFAPSGTTTTSLVAGGAANTLSVTFGTDGNQYFGAWIDYNQNGTLESSEFLGASGNAGSGGTTSVSFSVPAGAINGLTRLRIVGGNDSPVTASQACGASSSTWGETQDYDVTITNGVTAVIYSWSPATDLSATTGATVTATNMTSTTAYTVTATTAAGCSNTATQTVTVNALPVVDAGADQTICSGTPIVLTGSGANTYAWSNGVMNGVSFTPSASGTYTVTGTDANGCQNTDVVSITVNLPSTSAQTATACSSYTWSENGQTYTASGAYTHVISGGNSLGCDSTITLNLTINQPTTSTQTVAACDSYTWAEDGMTYTTSGTYTYTISGGNSNGCDSTITLDLTINTATSSSLTVTACSSYTLNTMTYTASGIYTQVIPNVSGCDSTITLDLTINQPTSSSVSATACTSYIWAEDGMTYTTSGAYTATLTNAAGCDSVITLNLTIIQPTTSSVTAAACGSYTWAQNGTTYTASGAYTDTLPNAAGCDSVITLNLTIHPFPVATATLSNYVLTASNGTTYQWINCTTGSAISGATSQTYSPTANGVYAVIVTNANGCSDTSACVNVTGLGVKELTAEDINIFPNPTHDAVTIEMTIDAAIVEVLDASGKLLNTIHVVSGDKIDLSAYERGVYFLNVKTETVSSLTRVVKN